MRLAGKVAVVTGGASGFGEGVARKFVAEGAKVVIADRDGEGAERAAAALGAAAAGVRADVTRAVDVKAMLDAAEQRFGGLDILVNNAGASWWGLPQDIPASGFRKVMDVNVTGTFLSARHAARHMIAHGGGSIINIASVGAFISYRPEDGQVVPYTTSNAAIVHLTADLAAQWADHDIRVNAIAPGSIETGMTETLTDAVRDKLLGGILLRRLGRPEEICGALALLASKAGSFMTGQTILVDGGQSLA